MIFQATRFTDAIVRKPARSVIEGLRAVDRGAPTYASVSSEHDTYVDALRAQGVAVEVLSALEAYPDSVFVEDPALVFGSGAIVLRPGAPTRLGEAKEMDPVLRRRFPQVLTLAEGFADGGDCLTTSTGVLIGLSARTDRKGAIALIRALERLGHTGKIVETPPGVLHFKTDCSLLDEETVLSTRRLAASGVFKDFRVIEVPGGEEAAANALRVNAAVLIGDLFPRTRDVLERHGYAVTTLPTREIGLIDAGLSCMSLRWAKA